MITIKQGDDKRAIELQLHKNNDVFTAPESATVKFVATNGMCKEMELLDGKYYAVVSKEDTSKTGFYNAEVRVTYEDGLIETYPDNAQIKFRITQKVECEE